MEHVQLTLAADDDHELALEKCECGQYSLSIGSVTVHLEEETTRALARGGRCKTSSRSPSTKP